MKRLTSVIPFPVETMCLLSDENGNIKDLEYKNFTAEMYSEGHSFFTFINDSPSALASCCRLRNEITENVFSFTNGLSGLKTGSCNVITLNLNRIIQDFYKDEESMKVLRKNFGKGDNFSDFKEAFIPYFTKILSRIYILLV